MGLGLIMKFFLTLTLLVLSSLVAEAGPALVQGTCPGSMDIITVTSSASSGAGSFSEALNNVATTNGCIDVLTSEITITTHNAYSKSFRLHGNGAVLSGSGTLDMKLYAGTDDFYLQDLTNIDVLLILNLTALNGSNSTNAHIDRYTAIKTDSRFEAGSDIADGATVEINNSTIFRFTSWRATIIANNSTFSNRFTAEYGGNAQVKNSILGGCAGSITSLGGVVSSSASCSPDIQASPLLGPIQDNGGLTWTAAIADDSPAFNAGSSCLSEDQRGVSRPQMGTCDSGAFELELCTTEVACLQTVIAKQSTVIAVLRTPSSSGPTPSSSGSESESIDYTLSSGDTFTIRREATYGSIFTGAIGSFVVLLMLLAFPTVMVFWRR